MIETSKTESGKRILSYGMVGGGPDSFIGAVHRAAIGLNGEGILVAGCFSRDTEKNEKTGNELHIEKSRVYKSYSEMAEAEVKRADGIDFVSIVTPNNSHYDACKEFLKRGINVVCEKPLTVTLTQAFELKELAKKNGCLFCVCYTYTGHVMAKQAKAIVKNGEIGEILTVVAEYPQDWLIDTVEKKGSKQASWRTDPKQSGASNCIGDIGSHIENMVSYITGLRIKKLCAKMDVVGEGRLLDTNSSVLIRYDNGASGNYWCSQVAIGYDNALRVRIFGTKGALEFVQEESNYLKVTKKGQPSEIMSRGSGYISSDASRFSRLPTGHPEGYIEAFGNIYKEFMSAVANKLDGNAVNENEYDYPKIEAGINGVKFIENCVESNSKGSIWVNAE